MFSIMLEPFVHIWVCVLILHRLQRNAWHRTKMAKMRTLFVSIALVPMHPRRMILSFGRVLILP